MRTHVSAYRKKAAIDECRMWAITRMAEWTADADWYILSGQNIKKFSMRSEGVNRPEYSAADKEARLSLNLSYYNTFSISVEVM